MAAGPSDLLHAPALLCGQLVLQRQLCHAQNGVERRADFMAHHRDEAGRALCARSAASLAAASGVRLALLSGHVHPHAVKQHAAIRQPPRAVAEAASAMRPRAALPCVKVQKSGLRSRSMNAVWMRWRTGRGTA